MCCPASASWKTSRCSRIYGRLGADGDWRLCWKSWARNRRRGAELRGSMTATACRFWIDTRDAHNIHRASRFCHRFIFLPSGGGQRLDQAVAELVPINRAKESPKPVAAGSLRVQSTKRHDGYLLHAFIPASTLTGYDPNETQRLGFSYAVVDRELGWQTFSVGPEFPFVEDPSLWGTLELDR